MTPYIIGMSYSPPARCPMCHNSSLESYDGSSPNFHLQHWKCKDCQTSIFTDENEITAYYLEITHKGKKYEAGFYPRLPNKNARGVDPNAQFILEYLTTNEVEIGVGWVPLLVLPFIPEMTADNFDKKLQTIL